MLVHALIEIAGMGMTIDEDCIVMTPEVPLMEIYENLLNFHVVANNGPDTAAGVVLH
jgi:hypothetical protein